MKKITTLVLLIIAGITQAQIINFSDPNFKARLLTLNIDTNNDGEIDVNEAEAVYSLDISSYNFPPNEKIVSIDEILYFTNLTDLNCAGNYISSLNVQGINLQFLDCSDNYISSLDVQGMNLLDLNCSYNQLSLLDVQGMNLINLNCSNNQLPSLNVQATNIEYLDCSYNQLSTLDVQATNIEYLDCSENQLSTLDVQGLNLKHLDCSGNQIPSLNIQGLTNLQTLYCFNNQIPSLNVQGLNNLHWLSCSNNLLPFLNVQGLTNLQSLDCSNNQLPSLNVQGLTNLYDLNCSSNQIPSLNVIGLTNLRYLQCSNNQLPSLDVQGLTNLQYLDCSYNQITSLNVQGLTNLQNLFCGNNQLPSLNVQGLTNLTYLDCSNNQLPSLDVQGLTNLHTLSCSFNQIPTLNVQGLTNLHRLFCSNNQIATLDIQGLSQFNYLECINNQLTTLNVKCGNAAWVYNTMTNTLYFAGNLNLQYICADEEDVAMVQQKISDYGYTNCHVNSYCSFTPGGAYYTINGTNRYDENNNGCDALDIAYPNLKLNINSSTTNGGLIGDETGHYFYDVQAGSYMMTPQLENPTYFNVSPNTSVSVSFPTQGSPFTQNYCISANGTHHDLELTLIPVTVARPGFDAVYKIKYKNKGTQTETATINFTFDDSVLDFVSATTAPTVQNVGNLVWNLGSIAPFQSGEITFTLNLNSPVETPALDSGDVLNYTAIISGLNTDETPIDNVFNLPQIVVNSHDPNEKTCLEGNQLNTNSIGQYVHYMIRFENTGTYPAQNIVVADVIDVTKFDVSSIQMVTSSHSCYTRIKDNKLEFVFENINLPFDDANNDGYVVFKIKTLPSLSINSSISNTANIYFDYNAPIVTNTATSTIAPLANPTFVFNDYFTLSPVPAKEVLNITSKQESNITSISIYNTLGQLMLVTSNPSTTIDVSSLITGTYFIKVVSDKGTSSGSFSKE